MTALRTAFNHIKRSPCQSVLVILTLTFSFFLISSFTVLCFASQQVLSFFEGKPQVIAYLDDEATSEQVLALKSKLDNSVHIKESRSIS